MSSIKQTSHPSTYVSNIESHSLNRDKQGLLGLVLVRTNHLYQDRLDQELYREYTFRFLGWCMTDTLKKTEYETLEYSRSVTINLTYNKRTIRQTLAMTPVTCGTAMDVPDK